MGIEEEIASAVRTLRSGGVVGMPTETVYGLAGIASDERAVSKIFELKARPLFDPLIVHLSKWSEIDSVVRERPTIAEILGQEFWPGPLTMVLPKRSCIPDIVTSGLDSVAVRIPNHPVAQKLIAEVGAPLAAPSANKFGKTSPTTAEHVRSEFPNENLLVLDGGECAGGIESTVIGFERENDQDTILIYRPGLVTEEDLRRVLSAHKLSPIISYANAKASPGQLEQHYMPRLPFALLESLSEREFAATQFGCSKSSGIEIHLDENPLLAARMLYGELRKASAGTEGFLYLCWNPEWKGGAWTAIRNRVERAATYKKR